MKWLLGRGAAIAAGIVFALAGLPVVADSPSSQPALSSSELAGLYRAIEAPKLDASMPAPERIMVGRAEVRPAPGSKIWRMTANGRPCGVLLDGAAAWIYRVEDRFSRPVAKKNARRVRLDTTDDEGALLLRGNLRGAAVWSWSIAGEIASGDRRWEKEDAPRFPTWASERLERRLSANPSRDLLMSDAEGAPRYAWALFHGDREDYVLDWDARAAVASENLVQAETEGIASPYHGRWSSLEIATQPIGRSWWEAPTALEWTGVDSEIDVREEDGGRARVASRILLKAEAPGLRMVALSLLSETVNAAGSLRPANLERVTVAGAKASYVADRNHVIIALPMAPPKGGTVEVETVWSGELFIRPNGDSYWRVGGIPWYPAPTGAGTDAASAFRIALEVKKPFVPFAPGTVVERTSTPKTNRVLTELSGPMSIAYLAAGKYESATVEDGNFKVGISTYGARLEGELEHAGQVVIGARQCLAELLAEPYPFSELQLVEVNEWGWGQAPPGMIFITKEAFFSKARVRAMPSQQRLAKALVLNVDARLTHEVAHGWFPHVARVDDPTEAWLSESFAEYVSSICASLLAPGPSERDAAWRSQLTRWKDLTRSLGSDPAASVLLANHMPVRNGEDFAVRRALLYGKGPLVLHALRQELQRNAGNEADGDRAFFGWLRRILKDRHFRITHTGDVVAILEEMTGKPWRPWFERYVLGGEVPAVE